VNVTGPQLLPADVRGRLQALRLLPRRAHGSHGVGQHASRRRGSGLEFAQYRAYEPGDDLRQIDWKLYARSDRFFVREAEREDPITVWLLLDASASAAQCDQARPGYSRLQHMAGIAACVLEVTLRQGDRFGVLGVDGDGLQLLPAGSGPRHRDRALALLTGLQPRGQWPAPQRLRPLWERVRAGDLLFALGDGFDEQAIEALQRLSAARREVLHVQVLGADERDFPFTEGHRFRDPETGAELLGDGRILRASYLQRFAEARHALQQRLRASGIAHTVGWMDEALDRPLQTLCGQGGRR